jgi:UDP-glucose 4-epimerase
LNVLVTGAAGYIGQHLCMALLRSGYQVRGFSRSEQPAHLSGVEWVIGDLTDKGPIDRVVAGCQMVVHLACLPLSESRKNPLRAEVVNVEGTMRVLEAAANIGVDKFIYTSTGQVYGGQASLPNREDQCVYPDTAYAISKLHGEKWCDYYAKQYHIPVTILRLFNVYGAAVAGTPRSTIDSVFINEIQQGRHPTISGSPESGRDFIYFSDVLSALLLAIKAPVIPGPINIGTGILTTYSDLARTAGRILGREDLEPRHIETGEPPIRFQADVTSAKQDLGFDAKVSLEDGLKIQCNSRSDQS